MKNICICIAFLFFYINIPIQSSRNDIYNEFSKGHNLGIINLDKDPELKKYYDDNEDRIPSSRSNVIQTGANGRKEYGFYAMLLEEPKINNSEKSRNYMKKSRSKICKIL